MFVLFLVAAAAPAALMAVLTYQGVTSTLNRQAHAEMAGYGKAYGLGLVARLRIAATLLRESAGDAPGLAGGLGAAGDPEERIFRSVDVFGHRSAARIPELPESAIARLTTQARSEGGIRGEFLVWIVPPTGDGQVATLALAVLADGSNHRKDLIVGVVEPRYAFGDGSYLPPHADLCIFDGHASRIHCSDPRLEGQARSIAAAAGTAAGTTALKGDTEFGTWTLHGNDEFERMPWTFIAMRPSSHGVLAERTMIRTYAEVGLAGFLLVALLSLAQMRRSLGPLDDLMRGTQRLAEGDFERPIRAGRGDEFGLLAQSFNHMAAMIRDREGQLRFEARQDSLTQLPNRLGTGELIDERIAGAEGRPASFAVLFIDLDRFKNVNDGLGHEAGDALLAEVADRVRKSLGDGEVVARWGGDEFIVLSAFGRTPAQVKALAEGIIAAISRVFRVGGVDAYVGASIGASFFPADGATREALVRNADVAMYYAKEAGRGGVAFYEAAMSRSSVDLLGLEADLRRALVAGEILVHFQPRLRLADGKLVGAEALARWKHPVRGMVSPVQFIALAERIGVIDALACGVLTQACVRLADWKRRGIGIDRVSVNVSAHEFRNPRLVDDVRTIVRAAGLAPADIELEITESAFIEDMEAARRILGEFRAAGFRLALDDFGTGFSSMSHLQSLPLDVLKIDQRFVKDLESKADSSAIALAIIQMGHGLGMRVVAEGVETPEQAGMLRDWGCDEGQGYLFARPLPADEFERFCTARKAIAARSLDTSEKLTAPEAN
jgi:diguanylate cyclase (GGDEF)-like protein